MIGFNYDKNKAYFCCLDFTKNIGLLRKVGDKYAWVSLSNNNAQFDNVFYLDINTAIENLFNFNCINLKTFDTVIEGVEYYQNKGIL